MLPAGARLRRGSEVTAVARRGVRARRDDLTVHLLPVAELAARRPAAAGRSARAAVVVGRGAGGAVARNRLKRRLRHGLRAVWDQVPPGAQLVVRADAGAARLDPLRMQAALTRALAVATGRAADRYPAARYPADGYPADADAARPQAAGSPASGPRAASTQPAPDAGRLPSGASR